MEGKTKTGQAAKVKPGSNRPETMLGDMGATFKTVVRVLVWLVDGWKEERGVFSTL